MINRILVPVDGSTHAMAAVDWASDIAIKYAAKLVILHVVADTQLVPVSDEVRQYAAAEHMPVGDVVDTFAQEVVANAEKRARSYGTPFVESMVEVGRPADVILARAERMRVELIVMGRRGLSRLESLSLGSVSSKVQELAECPCLTVK
jgi:nucleotide-binding universal stress UspA family protein